MNVCISYKVHFVSVVLWKNIANGSIMYDEEDGKVIFQGKDALSGKMQINIRGKLRWECVGSNDCC